MNSLTVNNRLSQQPGMYEYRPLRHECRLPNSLVVRNHRENSLTVGDESCRSLTAGFGMEGDFMSMSFAGNQKLSALSICARATRMSVLALCGNSGVILLSVKRQEHIDSAIPGRYTVQAPHKAGAGRGNPEFNIEHNRAHAVFSCHEHCYAQIMVGRAGPVSAGPGSMLTGISTPVRLTTYKVVESLGGEFIEFNIEAATMATVPTLAQPEIRIINGQAVTSSLAVADYFTKRHDDVLKKIRALDCSPEFTARNFAVSDYTDASGRKLPCYNITRDGFAFLAMGFTGKRAAQFKEAYINAFNQMEKRCITALSLFDYLRLLRLAGVSGYISRVAVNPATGFSSLKLFNAHNRASGFFVCKAQSHLNYGGLGRGAERLAGIVGSRSANPAQVTTSCLAASRGGYKNLSNGAVNMTTIPTLDQPELCVIDGKVVTSSLAVADYFHKPHKDVLAKISRLDCSVEFTERNFSLSKYTNVTGRKLPCYHITRNGFAFLAMSFTGKRAARFKEAYIKAFDQMERQLSTPSVLSDTAHNASVLYSYISSIHQVWLQQLYPMLEKAESPLAVSLHDRINDAAALASLINMTLNRSEVRGRK
ncbi:hypothetical protein IR649_000986 [Salmonella enterica]|nr:hypothetical protein [Salmonella enterica]EDP8907965.1 hypothetical protein [Salmonella enterica subsp. enterica serovar Javiana]EAU0457957.1 hypothetical protein [Salmonella enterica]EAZ0158995.1 hypothetical protein [Salmonella enterica]EBC4556499.1 hypothetical protein [Salmonella enterica]